MKNILYLIAGLLLLSCQEDAITPSVRFENLFEIKDNPSDSIQHKIYQFYTDYGVSVYFTDTVGRTFLKTDSRGDSVFTYELLDMNYSFSNNSNKTKKYKHTFIKDSVDKIQALKVTELFLKKAGKGLIPYTLLITEETKLTEGVNPPTPLLMAINYRMMLLGNLGIYTTPALQEKFVTDIIKFTVSEKIKVYEVELAAFHEISKKWYNQGWNLLYPGDSRVDMWFGTTWLTDPKRTEEEKAFARSVFGKFGFVSSGYNNNISPIDNKDDLGDFLSVVLATSREEFIRLWGTSPLVMQKYEILYSIISGQLGVEL